MVFTAVASSIITRIFDKRDRMVELVPSKKLKKNPIFPLSQAILYYSPVLNANCFRQNGNINCGATKTGGRARLSGFVRAFGNVSYKYNLDDQAHPSPQELETMRVFRGSPSRTFWRNSIKEVGEESVAMSPRNSVCFASPLLSWMGMNLLPSYWTKPV